MFLSAADTTQTNPSIARSSLEEPPLYASDVVEEVEGGKSPTTYRNPDSGKPHIYSSLISQRFSSILAYILQTTTDCLTDCLLFSEHVE
jgi:hypothetical protein